MNFDQARRLENPRLGEMYESLTNISKQLTLLQGFLESKFGSEFATFCQLSEQTSSSSLNQTYGVAANSMHEEGEEYDKMPNLVSEEESPSRTLGYVTVPLRQSGATGAGSTPKLQAAPANTVAVVNSRRERNNIIKEEINLEPQAGPVNEDMMYPLHNFSDLLVEDTGEVDANQTPEFLELELDPSTLLRGEPPALQPMFTESNGQIMDCSNSNSFGSSQSHKRNGSRQCGNTIHNRFDMDVNNSSSLQGPNISRRASVGGHENNHSQKKFDCVICGIKFEFAETLKSHMDSHAGIRSIRSNSEDQTNVGTNPNAPPLPKLMPRPSMTSVTLPAEITVEPSPLKSTKKRKHNSSQVPQSSAAKVAASLKKRKRCNQTRPSSLVCPECGLKIRDRSRLIEHLRGHTGERPFQCSFCDKSYTRKDVLKTHILKMHGDASQLISDLKFEEEK